MALAFFSSDVVRWLGKADHVDVPLGREVTVPIFPDYMGIVAKATNDTVEVDSVYTISWPSQKHSIRYEVFEDTLSSFPSTQLFKVTISNFDTLFTTSKDSIGVFYYRVRSVTDYGKGPFHSTGGVSVAVIGGIIDIKTPIPPEEPFAVAEAGSDREVQLGTIVELDGGESRDALGNAGGESLNYSWTAPSGVTLSDPAEKQPSFRATESGTFQFILVVTDRDFFVRSAPDTVTIRVNTPPVAHAGDDQEVNVGDQVQLDGSDSRDEDGDALTYEWTRLSGPVVTLSGRLTAQLTFTPGEAGEYTFELVVNDGQADSAPDTVAIRVNTPPVAHAGDDQTVNVGDQVQLDGSDSRDEDGDALTYEWTRLSGPVVTLSGRLTAQLTFIPEEAGEYIFELVVNDGQADSAPDTVAIRVNTPLEARAGDDQEVNVGDQVQLDGSGSTGPDGDALTYEWTRLSGPVVTLSGRTTAQLTFIPEEAGEYIFELVVNDGTVASELDEVVVRATEPEPSLDIQ